jgi:alpha-beta hydrolase superfamily lysophospholipase
MMRHHTGIQFPGIKRTVTTSDGVSLSVREYGPRDAAHTVVLLHGLCLNKDSWTIQIGHLLRQYGDSIRIISYDHRGHGDSAAAPMQTYHIDQLATDLADPAGSPRCRRPPYACRTFHGRHGGAGLPGSPRRPATCPT